MLDVTEALQHVDIRARDDVYHTCRALLVHRHEDLAIFDRAFDAFWNDRRAEARRTAGHATPAAAPVEQSAVHQELSRQPSKSGVSERCGRERRGGASASADLERRRHARAARTSPSSPPRRWPLARAALARLVWNPGERRTRRWVSGSRTAPRPAARPAPEPPHGRRRRRRCPVVERRRRQRPIVLLCDVSGSMERYSRMLLQFAHAISRRHRRLEAFLFSTRLTRITDELRVRGGSTRRSPPCRGRCPTGRAARESGSRFASCTCGGRGGCFTAVPSCC